MRLPFRPEEPRPSSFARAVPLLAGALVGAGLVCLLDPARGRRAARTLRRAGDALGATSRDLAHRTGGTVAELRARLARERVDDDVLEARVRSQLGHVLVHARAVTVTARDGDVALAGPVLAAELGPLLDAARGVRGVRAVVNRLVVREPGLAVPGLAPGRTDRLRPRPRSAMTLPSPERLGGAVLAALVVGRVVGRLTR